MSILSAVETRNWVWFEEGLAYDNARLPQALIVTGISTGTPGYVEAGLRSLRWLMTQQTAPAGPFRPVGTAELRRTTATSARVRPAARGGDGDDLGLPRGLAGGRRCRVEGRSRRAPSRGFSAATICPCRWSIFETGSCRDGLHPDRANENRGGESVVSYLLGLAEIRQLDAASTPA